MSRNFHFMQIIMFIVFCYNPFLFCKVSSNASIFILDFSNLNLLPFSPLRSANGLSILLSFLKNLLLIALFTFSLLSSKRSFFNVLSTGIRYMVYKYYPLVCGSLFIFLVNLYRWEESRITCKETGSKGVDEFWIHRGW